MIIHCPTINCPGTDFPITNYSSEGSELVPPYVSVVYPPVGPDQPIDNEWGRQGCLYYYVSYISQEDADLGALRQAVLCSAPPTEEIWYSTAVTCSAVCADGSEFFYTVPAGMFIASTLQQATDQAQAYACAKAQENKLCLDSVPSCLCVGTPYSVSIHTTPARSNLTWSISGTLPTGLSFFSSSSTAVISGTPTVAGLWAFSLIASNSTGYTIKVVAMKVLEITTTVLPDFTVGDPYSFQLVATGGTGNYIWSDVTGLLPDGLTISASGLISGTPTLLAIDSTPTFKVTEAGCIDGCEKQLALNEAVGSLPYAYFKLDDDPTTKTVIDEISGFNLTSTNVYSQWPTAKIGTALWDPWLRLSDAAGSSHWDFAATGFTVRLWFQLASIVNNTFFIMNVNSDPANVTEWELSLQAAIGPLRQYPRFRMVLSGGDVIVDGPDITDTTSFHRLMFGWEKGVCVWLKFDDAATIKVATVDTSPNGGINTKLFLGPTNESQQMGIDEVGIWNRTLSEAEMTFDWNGGAGRTYP